MVRQPCPVASLKTAPLSPENDGRCYIFNNPLISAQLSGEPRQSISNETETMDPKPESVTQNKVQRRATLGKYNNPNICYISEVIALTPSAILEPNCNEWESWLFSTPLECIACDS